MSFELIVFGISIVLVACFCENMFRKAGYSGTLGLLMLIPVVNAVVFMVFCVVDWPVQYELARLRLSNGEGGEADAEKVFTRATKLEQRGDWDGGIKLFRVIVSGMSGTEWADDASKQIEAIQEKQAMAGLV